jgi:outer membrane protein TolC
MRQDGIRRTVQAGIGWGGFSLLFLSLAYGVLLVSGCRTPVQYRENADKVADKIIEQKQKEALGKTEPLSIDRPSDILRRRLLEVQGLPYSSTASLGTDQLKPITHWPKDTYPPESHSPDANIPVEPNAPVQLALVDVLQVAARNSPDYQSRKEDVFRTALALDLSRNSFRPIFSAQADSEVSTTTGGGETTTSVASGGSAGVRQLLENGADLSAVLALDLVNLLTQGGGSSLGLAADTSISIPLLRGSGRWIVREPLTQAERNVIYRIWDFERFKRSFAVSVAQDYYTVLRQADSLANSENNYRSAVQSARYARRQADAGRLPQIQVDEAVQRELTARTGWISAQAQLKSGLDSFKASIGLPADALIDLDPNDLTQLRARAEAFLEAMRATSTAEAPATAPAADAPVELVPPNPEEAGPYEIDEAVAVKLALEHRLDLQTANGAVYDAQRQVVIAADALRAGLTLGGQARFTGNDDNGGLAYDGARYAALLSLNLPIERTRERNEYRNSLIDLERATRTVQDLEDQIKVAIRGELRRLLESRENLKIQAQSVVIAQKRVRNAQLLLEAGRIEIRYLLDAQDSLLSAQNSLTRAIVDYRLGELQLQRDLDLLTIDEKGLWQEFTPGAVANDL